LLPVVAAAHLALGLGQVALVVSFHIQPKS
jgi:hypothetical protein